MVFFSRGSKLVQPPKAALVQPPKAALRGQNLAERRSRGPKACPMGRSWRRVGHLRSRLMLEACGALGCAWASSPRSYVGRALGLLRRRSELEARGSWPRSSSRVGRSWSCRSLWPRMVTPSCLASGAEVLAAAVRAASRAEVGRRCLRFAPKLWALIRNDGAPVA